MYKRAARGDLSLLKHEFNPETPAQKGLAFKDFPRWKTALDKIPSPIYRAYHLCELLTGARPGELARLRWEDIKPRERLIVIGKAKAGADTGPAARSPKTILLSSACGTEQVLSKAGRQTMFRKFDWTSAPTIAAATTKRQLIFRTEPVPEICTGR